MALTFKPEGQFHGVSAKKIALYSSLSSLNRYAVRPAVQKLSQKNDVSIIFERTVISQKNAVPLNDSTRWAAGSSFALSIF